MKFESISVAKVDLEKQIVKFDWIYENDKLQEPSEANIDDRNRFSSWVVRNKKSIKINEALTGKEVLRYKDEIKPFNKGVVIQSMIICPIMIKDEIYGIISVQSTKKFQYTEYDLEVLNMFSSFIAVAMKNWNNTESLKDANQKLEILSKTDALTGISNRHVLSEIVEQLFHEKEEENNKISVVMIDIDYFKEFNDTYGHIEGDRCIIRVVDQLVKHLDSYKNRLFRYGGDEFVCIIPHISHKEIMLLLEETRRSIEEMMIRNKYSKTSEYVTCSFGYTTVVRNQDMDYQKAFYLADKALYVAKANGKNQITYEKNS